MARSLTAPPRAVRDRTPVELPARAPSCGNTHQTLGSETVSLTKEPQMFRRIAGKAGSALALSAALTVGSGAATQPASAGEFGQHVRACVQTMGFSGEHNPGVHQGFNGWHAELDCGSPRDSSHC